MTRISEWALGRKIEVRSAVSRLLSWFMSVKRKHEMMDPSLWRSLSRGFVSVHSFSVCLSPSSFVCWFGFAV